MEGSSFYPKPVCTHICKPSRLPVGRVLAGGSRERLLMPYNPLRFISFLPVQHDKPNRIVGRFREPPARQLLRNATVVCRISSGYGQPSKAAPLQGNRPRTAAPPPLTPHVSPLPNHAPVASTALRSAFNSPGVNSISPAFAFAIACSPLRAPTRACVQPG
jgi:hypothetical protein